MRYFKEEEDDDDDAAEDFSDDLFDPDFISMAELGIKEAGLRRKILSSAIKMSEKDVFWKFYSLDTKLSMIKKAFIYFNDLLENKGKEPELGN